MQAGSGSGLGCLSSTFLPLASDAFMGEQVQHVHWKVPCTRSELGEARAAGAAPVWATGLAVVVLARVAELGALAKGAEAAKLRVPGGKWAALTRPRSRVFGSGRGEGFCIGPLAGAFAAPSEPNPPSGRRSVPNSTCSVVQP